WPGATVTFHGTTAPLRLPMIHPLDGKAWGRGYRCASHRAGRPSGPPGPDAPSLLGSEAAATSAAAAISRAAARGLPGQPRAIARWRRARPAVYPLHSVEENRGCHRDD